MKSTKFASAYRKDPFADNPFINIQTRSDTLQEESPERTVKRNKSKELSVEEDKISKYTKEANKDNFLKLEQAFRSEIRRVRNKDWLESSENFVKG